MVTASQIRQDLNCFGGFGQQGYGYNVELLHREIGEILGVSRQTPAILIGCGNLGHALANQQDLRKKGFELIAAFDNSPKIIGSEIAGLKVKGPDELANFCIEYKPKMAILCIPTAAVAELADTLINLGIVGFWNFSSYDFNYNYPDVTAVNVHLSDSIMTLSYMVTHLHEDEDTD